MVAYGKASLPTVRRHSRSLTTTPISVILSGLRRNQSRHRSSCCAGVSCGRPASVWIVSRPVIGRPVGDESQDFRRTAFEVKVEWPRMDRSLGGRDPSPGSEENNRGPLRFNHASRGARISSVATNRLSCAEGGDYGSRQRGRSIAKGAPGFPDGDREKNIRCVRPRCAVGNRTPHEERLHFRRSFVGELDRCENAEKGRSEQKRSNPGEAWPSSAAHLRGIVVLILRSHRAKGRQKKINYRCPKARAI